MIISPDLGKKNKRALNVWKETTKMWELLGDTQLQGDQVKRGK